MAEEVVDEAVEIVEEAGFGKDDAAFERGLGVVGEGFREGAAFGEFGGWGGEEGFGAEEGFERGQVVGLEEFEVVGFFRFDVLRGRRLAEVSVAADGGFEPPGENVFAVGGEGFFKECVCSFPVLVTDRLDGEALVGDGFESREADKGDEVGGLVLLVLGEGFAPGFEDRVGEGFEGAAVGFFGREVGDGGVVVEGDLFVESADQYPQGWAWKAGKVADGEVLGVEVGGGFESLAVQSFQEGFSFVDGLGDLDSEFSFGESGSGQGGYGDAGFETGIGDQAEFELFDAARSEAGSGGETRDLDEFGGSEGGFDPAVEALDLEATVAVWVVVGVGVVGQRAKEISNPEVESGEGGDDVEGAVEDFEVDGQAGGVGVEGEASGPAESGGDVEGMDEDGGGAGLVVGLAELEIDGSKAVVASGLGEGDFSTLSAFDAAESATAEGYSVELGEDVKAGAFVVPFDEASAEGGGDFEADEVVFEDDDGEGSGFAVSGAAEGRPRGRRGAVFEAERNRFDPLSR